MARDDGTHLDDLRDGYRDGRPATSTEQAPRPAGGAAPLAPLEFLRYCWRQLTSMRTALFLLMLLAVAAVPGSTFPQENNNPSGVATWIADHPTAGPWVDRLQGFHVYSSAWFSAIYLLLFVSLVGCVLPRARVHLAALRARPPRTPTRLSRLPEHAAAEVEAPPEVALEAARAALRSRRFRLDVHAEPGGGSVAAERGHHRETGNLLFHLSLVGLLLAVASGSLFSYSGQRIVTVGSGMVGTVGSWDSFSGGVWASASDVPPFALTLDGMDVAFEAQQTSQIGEPRQFAANVTLTDAPGDAPRKETIKVNHPAELQGTQISLSGNGYAPVLTYRDGSGAVVKSGPVPFLPQTANYDSTGVVKLPDATDAAGKPVQVGLRGVFLPSATVDASGTPVSGFPDLANPLLIMVAFTGNLGLDDGVAQNVYELDDSRLTQVEDGAGRPFAIRLQPGQAVQLPDGLGTVTFDSVERFASFDVRHTPGQREALVFALLAATGLILSLFVPRRRVWVRVRGVDGRPGVSHVEVAGLARGNDAGLREEVDGLLAAVRTAAEPTATGGADVGDDGVSHEGSREHVDATTGRTPEEGS